MVKEENIILSKTYDFALEIIKVYKELAFKQIEYDIGRQLLRCGTSIGSNAEEAAGAQSRKDFIAKFSIAYKESRETRYWLRLLKDSDIMEVERATSLINDCEEIQRIIASILKTSTVA